MGTELTGRCDCGFGNKVYIASGRAQHGKVFKYPHYCSSCHSLISVDVLSDSQICSECGSDDIHSYAASTKTLSYKSLLSRFPTEVLKAAGYHRSDVVHEETFCYPLRKTFVFLRGDHYCPKCKKSTMRFFTSMLYD
jgi:ribosomal protein L37AE/L43A